MRGNENQLLICGSVHTLLAFLSSSSDSRPWHQRSSSSSTETCRAACVCPTNPQTHSSRSHSQHLQKPVALVPSVTFYNHRQISDPRARSRTWFELWGFKQRRYRPVYKRVSFCQDLQKQCDESNLLGDTGGENTIMAVLWKDLQKVLPSGCLQLCLQVQVKSF